MARRLVQIAWFLFGAWAAVGCEALPENAAGEPTASLRPWSTPTRTPAPPTAAPTIAATIEAGPSPTPFKHIVRPNETILQIAALYGVTADALRAVNPELGSGDLLSIGQELRIPDAEGNPIGSLIPTATPIPLAIQPPTCYPRPTRGVWCLTAVRNASDQMLENLVVEVEAVDAGGDVLGLAEVYPPLNFLPGGGLLPMVAIFGDEAAEVGAVSAIVRSAIAANSLETRYRQPEITRSTDLRQTGGRSWLVGGTLTVPADAPVVNRTLLLVTALGDTGQVVGYAVWEPPAELFPGQTIPYEVRVFSLGPPIARIEVMAETYALARPRN
jgi:LysM repeat protein